MEVRSQVAIRRLRARSLRSTLLALAILALAPGFLLAGFQHVGEYRRRQADTYARVTQAVRVALRHHADAVAAVTSVLRVQADDLARRPLDRACESLTRAMSATHLPFVVGDTADARLVCAQRVDNYTPHLSDDDVRVLGTAIAQGRLAPGRHFLAGDQAGSKLGIAFPLPGHEADGFIAVFLPLEWFQDLSEDLHLPPGSTLNIVNAQGIVLARDPAPEQWVGSVVADRALFRMMTGAGDPGVTVATGLDGISRIYAYARIGAGTPASYLSIGISTEELRRQAFEQIGRTVAGFLVAALCAWLISGWAAERLVLRQARSLIARARTLANGDGTSRVDRAPDGPRELNELATAFNRMATRIRVKQQRLDHLSQELLRAQEKERQQIARELHDQMGQSLTALKISLQIEKATRGESAPLSESFRIIDGLIAEVRDLALSLRPPLLQEQGLRGAIAYLVATESKRSGLREVSHLEIGEARFAPEVELVVFRIAQESITNVARHAGATTLTVTLASDGGRLRLTVEDDGAGFDVDAAPDSPRGFGLLSMHERAELAHGHLEVSSVPGRGTTVRLTIPV